MIVSADHTGITYSLFSPYLLRFLANSSTPKLTWLQTISLLLFSKKKIIPHKKSVCLLLILPTPQTDCLIVILHVCFLVTSASSPVGNISLLMFFYCCNHFTYTVLLISYTFCFTFWHCAKSLYNKLINSSTDLCICYTDFLSLIVTLSCCLSTCVLSTMLYDCGTNCFNHAQMYCQITLSYRLLKPVNTLQHCQ